ncbi:MAG: Hsp33 family molecular chaperone HslO [Myxococcota bacterium]
MDSFVAGIIRHHQVAVGIAVTTEACRQAQGIHETSELATIALGRLLTAASLAAFSANRKGRLSLQIVARGPLRGLFSDVTDDGAIRTMVRAPRVPRVPDGNDLLRTPSLVARAIGEGTLTVIWQPPGEPFSQSTTALVSGEVDRDVEHFLTASDQVETHLIAAVDATPDNIVTWAGGVVLQAMPDTPEGVLQELGARLREGFESTYGRLDPATLGALLDEDVEAIGSPIGLRWACRCNYERVLGGLRLLGTDDLADMIDKQETAQVDCEFCGRRYEVPPRDVRALYEELLGSET